MTKKTEGTIQFERLAIVGVGLIGGSIGMAAKAKGLAKTVVGIGRSREKLQRAQELAAIDEFSTDIRMGVRDADLIVVCTPVRLIVPTIQNIAPNLSRGCIVTDVGSTKTEVCYGAEKALPPDCSFVGGHPMAGSEMSGVESAVPYLFLDATYVITPTERTRVDALNKVVHFTEALGANVILMPPEKHDRCASIISHIPHILSACLLKYAMEEQSRNGEVFGMAAGSFKDATRVALSPPVIWRDICITNKDAICDTLAHFESILANARETIASGDEKAIESLFTDAKFIKERFSKPKDE